MIRVLAMLAGLVVGVASAQAAPVQIFLAHAQRQNAGEDTAAAVADEFRAQVGNLSGGRLRVELLVDGVTGGNRDTVLLVEKGVLQSALVTVGGVTPVFPPLEVVQLPYAFQSLGQARQVLDGPFGQRLGDALAERTRLRLMGFVDPPGFHILTNSDRPVGTPEEMWGLRLRAIPGSKPLEAMIRAVGAAPVKVSSREELSALSSGAVDGQMNPVSVVLARGFDGVQRYATLTEHLYAPYVWVFNGAFLEGLTDEDRAILSQAARAAVARGHALAMDSERAWRALAELRRRLDVRALSEAERAAFSAAMRPPVEEAVVKAIGQDGQDWVDALGRAVGGVGR